MAKIKKTNENSGNKKGKLLSILTVLLVIVIILSVFGGVFYYIVYNNIGGVTEANYSALKKIPLLNLALPEPPDPLNPKYMTASEIKKQYIIFKDETEELKNQLDEALKKIDEYKVFKDQYDSFVSEIEEKKRDLDSREKTVKEKELELKKLKDEVYTLIASGDKEGYAAYFESIDPEDARLIYEKIVTEQQINENIKKFAQVYAEMDPAAAASVFEKLGASKIEMIAEILMSMNKKESAKILESMNPDFAATVTQKLDELYRGN